MLKSPVDRYLERPGGQVFVRSWEADALSDRAPILLIHDSLGSVVLWRDLPDRLRQATGRAVIAYDRLGFGMSSAREDRLKPSFIREEGESFIPSLCDELGIGSIVLCGHSVGGGMAVEAAAHLGNKCEALITISAQAFVEDRTVAGIEVARVLFRQQTEVDRLAKYHGEKARWAIDAWTETWLSPAFCDWSLDDSAARVTAPLLAIHGENDEYGSPAHPERLAQGRGRVAIIAEAGHLPHREKPSEVIDLIAEFLNDSAVRDIRFRR